MFRLLHGLLDLRRIDEGRGLPFTPDALEPLPLLRDAVSLIELSAQARRIEVVIEAAGTLPAVHADRDRMLQVLWNLLGNALRYTPENGRITLRAEAGPQDVTFTVADTGPGIAPEHLPHVFDAYWQADSSGGGAGMGLAICRAIVEGHGGVIEAESGAEGGTLFLFRIPLA